MDVQSMYQRSNPADEIVPGLWLGNRHAAADTKFSADKKIRAVFNCSKDIPFQAGIPRQYRIPVDDSRQEPDIANMEKWSYEIVYKISHEVRRAHSEGSAILVHCAAGMQRSAAATAMYLIAVDNITTDQAINLIQSKRPIAFRPEANFEKSIRGFEASFNRDVRPQLKVV
jgi:protein-tyrosine phosphatase